MNICIAIFMLIKRYNYERTIITIFMIHSHKCFEILLLIHKSINRVIVIFNNTLIKEIFIVFNDDKEYMRKEGHYVSVLKHDSIIVV